MLDNFFDKHKNLKETRRYVKLKKRGDVNNEILIQKRQIEDDENEILNVVSLNNETLIIHRPIFGEDPFDLLIIKLTVITPKGVVSGQLKLLANYINDGLIELGDIEVFGENRGKGYGSVLLKSLIEFAKAKNINKITGWISKVDEDHFSQLEKFYTRHGFKIIWLETDSLKAADLIWQNSEETIVDRNCN